MTNADATSTDSTTERAEKVAGQPPLVAVSEENLAALLRATSAPAEPEVQEAEAAPVAEAETESKDTPEVADAVASAPVEAEPTVTPIAAPTPAPVEQAVERPVEQPVERREYPAASLQPANAPIQVTLPKVQPVIPAAVTAMPAPSRNGLVIGGVAGALILVVGLFLLWPKGHPAKAPAAAAITPAGNTPFQVSAEPLGNGLINVRWNAQSSSIAQARDGRLVITEHDKAPRTMALDLEQLKIGHLTYQSGADSIQFDLEVSDRFGTVAKESILAMAPPAAPANATPQTPREQVATVKPQVAAQVAPPKVQVQTAAEAAPASPVKARAFVPPPTQQASAQRAIIDAPPALASAPVAPVGVNVPVPLGAVAAPPPAAPAQPVQVESTLQAGNLIKQVLPVYPLQARSAGIQGVVQFTALIGMDGKIRNLKVISGPAPLRDAASDAVRRWVYRPTLVNGHAVEVITQISVNFTMSTPTR